MKATRLAGVTLPAVLATMLAVLPASPAAAAAKKLVLKSAGTAVANGSPGSIGITVQECGIFSNGKVVTNNSAKDLVTGTTSSNTECPAPGESISGLIKEAQLKSSGSSVLKGEIDVTEPGPCIYAFKNPKAKFTPGSFLLFEAAMTGKLAKGSLKTCAKTDPQTLTINITNEVFGEPFGTSLA